MGVYKCNLCGNIVEVLHDGVGELICCGEPMQFLTEKTEDEGLEKHVPVVEKTEKGYLVKVGSVEHPMEDKHFIEWIELIADGELLERKYLKPGMKPEAEFFVAGDHQEVVAREYCSLHGLWSS